VVGRQPNAPATFTPGEIPGTHFKRLIVIHTIFKYTQDSDFSMAWMTQDSDLGSVKEIFPNIQMGSASRILMSAWSPFTWGKVAGV